MEEGTNKRYDIDEEGKKVSLASSMIVQGLWYHIALTWDANKASLYINGREVAVKRNPSIPSLSQLPFFYLNRNFSGDLDEVMIFDHALSEEKILRLSRKEDFSKAKSLVFYLPLDGNCKYLARRHVISSPARVKIYFPQDRYGYFPLGHKFPVKIIIPAAAGFKGRFEADISLFDLNNREIFARKISFSASISENVTITESIAPEKCGLYWVKVSIRNENR